MPIWLTLWRLTGWGWESTMVFCATTDKTGGIRRWDCSDLLWFHSPHQVLHSIVCWTFLEIEDLNRILLSHCPSCGWTPSFPGLTEVVSGVVLEFSHLVLGEFNIHADAALSGVTQDFMTFKIIMGLPCEGISRNWVNIKSLQSIKHLSWPGWVHIFWELGKNCLKTTQKHHYL